MSAETGSVDRIKLEQLINRIKLEPYMFKSYQGMKNVLHVPELPPPSTDASRNQ